MDSFLIKYLQSGKAWVLVGSGPSIEMGYPSWEQLASSAIQLVKAEQVGQNLSNLNKAMKNKDFPLVFQEATDIVGEPLLLKHLRDNNKPTKTGKIYDLITRWPVPVYMTTNYDDELQNNLVRWGESYNNYTNTSDHFGLLIPSLSGAIVKLHGDLRSERGLILTRQQYQEIEKGEEWQYWRTKMTSILQMNPIVIIGHSLSDTNIKHIIEAAKEGANVAQPICWIAPDVTFQESKELLENYKIRVIPYDNRDGCHKNLVKLIENISEFIPSRTVIGIQEQIARVSSSRLGNNAAAPGFFVFNIFLAKSDFEEKRIDIVDSAIKATLPELSSLGKFTFREVLEMAGWPAELPIDPQFLEQIEKRVVDEGQLIPENNEFVVNPEVITLAEENRRGFNHVRDSFKNSLTLRLKRDYSNLSARQIDRISTDIEASLTGYFREGGLSLASTLFSSRRYGDLPSSIIGFISLASARYDNLLMRQAFFTASVEAFAHPTYADKDYLGRISQGFFAFNVLGVFGDSALERLKDAKETVWLIDSSAQIIALALAAPTNALYRQCFSRLKDIGIRFFTTYSLFEETCVHLWFANKLIREHGVDSPSVIAAARGESPYRKANAFLQGFIRWQAAGNPSNWQQYLYQTIAAHKYDVNAIKTKLGEIGIEAVNLSDWPGFTQNDHAEVEEQTAKIAEIWEDKQLQWAVSLADQLTDPYEKAKPEAEALLVVKNERKGNYYVLSHKDQSSPAWFISATSMLNVIEEGMRITWQPDAFLRFASTLCDISDAESVDHAFDTLVMGVAQSGLNLLDEDIITRVFGATIDQTRLSMDELGQTYHENIEQKYGESPESVLNRIAPSYRPLAIVQLANEATMVAEKRQKIAEEARKELTERAEKAEKKLQQVSSFREKMEAKKQRTKLKARKLKTSRKKKKKKK